ncbi:MAG: helix-turn-helix domain-containing protein [Bacteroidetes bacterium]|nr:helix-turn-helix domain-containing protein [Bacteroidota bacterium]MBU1485858.1 helix-turn-helix domain-containing protein [Bacteroidota bacterium]MBU1762152.1 helix-turn-helix domain-containing protein [Bacteroidota bacterium]MBU2045494.1 helix-turn-helix domain-containing protein [Bacteroidota bacterium]MBU2268127.1 helix-turn-helix domain-containing protein [Bacteroidota bacterium]
MDILIERLEKIERLLESQTLLQKEVLNLNESALYLELSTSHLYRLTSTNCIPYYKPNGKKLYFKRTELDQWLLRNRVISNDEIETQSANYLIKKGRVV